MNGPPHPQHEFVQDREPRNARVPPHDDSDYQVPSPPQVFAIAQLLAELGQFEVLRALLDGDLTWAHLEQAQRQPDLLIPATQGSAQ